MSFPASDVYDMVRSLMNDQVGAVYTNTVLQPYLNIALRDLGSLLERANVPVTNSTSESILVTAGGNNIGGPDSGDPVLPDGLVEIQGLYQRQAGTDNDFFLVTRREFLTHFDEDSITTAYIPEWAWIEQVIRFQPSNVDLEIKLDFIKTALPTIDADATQISVIGSLNYLGYRTGSLAAMFIGENPTRAAVLDAEADKEWDQMEGTSTKGRQSIATRRRPFRQRNWGGTQLGW